MAPKVLFLVDILLCLYVSWFSMLPSINCQNQAYYFHHLTTSDNLSSQNFNYFIQKDQLGFVWISSADGLNRYDGREIEQYHSDDNQPFSLSDPGITSNFFMDQRKGFWFSTGESLQRYDRKHDRFESIQIKSGNQTYDEAYYLMHFDTAKENLWLRVDDTLFIHSVDAPPDQHILRSVYPLNFFARIYKNPSAQEFLLFIPLAQTNGFQLQRFREETAYGTAKTYLETFKVKCFYYQNDTNCWIGTDTGLVRLNLETGEYIYYSNLKVSINGISGAGNSKLIISSQKNGLYFFDYSSEGSITSPIYIYNEDGNSPFKQETYGIYVDDQKNLWVSTVGRGIYFTNLNKKRFNAFLQLQWETPLKNSYVKSVCEDKDGRLWCLTKNGVTVIDSNGLTIPSLEKYVGNSVPFYQDEPYFIFCDKKDRIWAATQSGLFLLPKIGQSFKKIRVEDRALKDALAFTHVYQLKDGTLIAASNSGVYKVHEERNMVALHKLPELKEKDKSFNWIYELPRLQIVLFRSMQGSFHIYQYKKGQLQYSFSKKFRPFVNYLVEDQTKKLLWVATPEGLYKMDVQTGSLSIEKDTIFPFQTLNALLQDRRSRALWISTNRGLVKYHPDSAHWQVYGLTDGIQGEEFNFWSAKQTKSGKLIFGGVNGINIFQPSAIKRLEVEAHPVITSILTDGRMSNKPLICDLTQASNLHQIKKIKKPFKENTFSIQFAALEYSDPMANIFRYHMTKIDEDWVLTRGENFAKYTDLSPGHYNFEVQATNSEGNWSANSANLEVVITPPWYLTWAFKTLAITIAALLIYLAYRLRIAQVKRRAAYEKRAAVFKQKEAEYKQLVAETEAAVKRLQMNPHFIFNSMTAIKSYILSKNIDTASDYLNRFAKLMRLILIYGDKPLISITQEIELITLYLETEAMRFEEKYTYAINFSEELDPDEIVLPTMILQPFVENAILHGIRPMQGQGLIQINFWQEKDKLHCTVSDNGVGRKKAQEIKIQSNAEYYESKALEITQRRLALLESTEGNPPSIQIKDLFDENQNPSGTEVQFIMPII